MNILKKKMGLDRPGPVIDLELAQIVWKDLQERASAKLSELIPVARFRAAPIKVSSFGRKKLTDQFAQGALISCFGLEADQTEMIIAASAKTGMAIGAGSFSTSTQSFSRTLLEALKTTLSKGTNDPSEMPDTDTDVNLATEGDPDAPDPLVQALFKDYTKALNQTLNDLYAWPETCEFTALTLDLDQIFLNEAKPRWVKLTCSYEIDLDISSLTLGPDLDGQGETKPNDSAGDNLGDNSDESQDLSQGGAQGEVPSIFELDVSFLISAHIFDHIMAGGAPDIQKKSQPDINQIIHRAQIAQSVTPLRAVLEDLVLSVADCTRLHIGQVIALPGTSIRAVRVEAELGSQIRHPVALATLGIYKSKKALKINGSVDTDFLIRPKP